MSEKDPRRRRKRQRSARSEEDPVFAGLVFRFAEAVQDMIWRRRSEGDGPDDDGGLAGSRVPRRPPDRSGSGSVALTEPVLEDNHSAAAADAFMTPWRDS